MRAKPIISEQGEERAESAEPVMDSQERKGNYQLINPQGFKNLASLYNFIFLYKYIFLKLRYFLSSFRLHYLQLVKK